MFGLEINIVMQTYGALEGCVIHIYIEYVVWHGKE